MKASIFDNLFGYFLTFTKIFRSSGDTLLRDANILNLQSNHSLIPPDKDDIIVGKMSPSAVMFNPQKSDGCPYLCDIPAIEQLLAMHKDHLSAEQLTKVTNAVSFWKNFFLLPICRNTVPVHSSCELLPDVDVLINEGLYRAKELVNEGFAPSSLKQAKLLTFTTINQSLDFYKYHTCLLMTKYPNNRNIHTIFDILNWIKYRPPRTFHAKVQLYWLYATIACSDHAQITAQLKKFQSETCDRFPAIEAIYEQIEALITLK